MILLLSDRQERAIPLQDDLFREGFSIDIVDSFSDAMLKLAQENSYYLILLDFEFSGSDVFDICHKFKSHSATRLIPLVCILGKDQVVEQLMAFEVGADDFIFVPYTTLDIQLKLRSIQRMIDLQRALRRQEAQLESLKNVQRVMVTLNHYINNALTPLYFAVQVSDEEAEADARRIKNIARDTVEFVSKVLQSLHQIVQNGKIKVVKEGIYQDIMIDIEQELKKLQEKLK